MIYYNLNETSFYIQSINLFEYFELDPIDCIWQPWSEWLCPAGARCAHNGDLYATRTRQKILTEQYGGHCSGESAQFEPCKLHCANGNLNLSIFKGF